LTKRGPAITPILRIYLRRIFVLDPLISSSYPTIISLLHFLSIVKLPSSDINRYNFALVPVYALSTY